MVEVEGRDKQAATSGIKFIRNSIDTRRAGANQRGRLVQAPPKSNTSWQTFIPRESIVYIFAHFSFAVKQPEQATCATEWVVQETNSMVPSHPSLGISSCRRDRCLLLVACPFYCVQLCSSCELARAMHGRKEPWARPRTPVCAASISTPRRAQIERGEARKGKG